MGCGELGENEDEERLMSDVVLLVAMPLGNLGDRIGRRKIMAVSLVGVVMSLLELFVVCK